MSGRALYLARSGPQAATQVCGVPACGVQERGEGDGYDGEVKICVFGSLYYAVRACPAEAGRIQPVARLATGPSVPRKRPLAT